MSNDWSKYIQEGRQYLKTARNGRKRKDIFNNELLCNLIGLSVEKLLVGFCLRHGHLPADHTLNGIVSEVNGFCPMDESLAAGICMADHIENLCSLEIGPVCKVSDRQVELMIAMNEEVALFVERHLMITQSAPAATTKEM